MDGRHLTAIIVAVVGLAALVGAYFFVNALLNSIKW